MKDSLKFLQAMQEITQLEINLLDGSDTFTDVGGVLPSSNCQKTI